MEISHNPNQSISSLLRTGTKLWLDSVDPELVASNLIMGATGATSNPIIIADLIKTGRFDDRLSFFAQSHRDPNHVAWSVTNELVATAEKSFLPTYERTHGDDGYVSFELDPLLEEATCSLTIPERVSRYIDLGRQWSKGHPNRMIKVPATPAGLLALEELAASGIPLNVTLIFTKRQYEAARNSVWAGAKRLKTLEHFKSVYSLFVSRIDVYTASQYHKLSPAAQGMVGIINAKLLWRENSSFWSAHKTPLKQEIVFASTGTKNPHDRPWKYVAALCGSDIQTNPPQTNAAVAASRHDFSPGLSIIDRPEVVNEVMTHINWPKLEEDLMTEGLEKFSTPQRALLELVKSKIPRSW